MLERNQQVEVHEKEPLFNDVSLGLMHSRGILDEGESLDTFIEETVTALSDIDSSLHGESDIEFSDRVRQHLYDGVFVLGTPVMQSLRRTGEATAACTVLNVSDPSGKLDLNKFMRESSIALSDAVGTGYDLSGLEDPNEALLLMNDALDGLNDTLIGQNKRPVASMATLRADHPKIHEFIRTKRDADFARWRFNISVFVTEELFEKAEADSPWELKDADGNIVESISARTLLREMAESAWYCGEPGILFKDRIDQDNPTPQWEYTSTAPCAEVAMASGEACQFSYINVGNLLTEDDNPIDFDTKNFGYAVEDMTRLLDAVVEKTITNQGALGFPLVEAKRRIGVGITGFADLLVKLGHAYDSPEATVLATQISELLDYHSKLSSVNLAKVRGAFPAFQQSRFTDLEWVQRKYGRMTGIIPTDSWDELYATIHSDGIRHASTTSMPPTGTSSVLVNSSKSLEPNFDLLDNQGEPKAQVREALSRHPDQELAQYVLSHIIEHNGMVKDEAILDNMSWLKTARQLGYLAHLDIQVAFQQYLDESVSKTINMPAHATVDDVLTALTAAYKGGLKGVALFRDGCLQERTPTQVAE